MTALRGRLRIVAFAWLLCQAASLAAFVPAECCPAHAAEAKAKAEKAACHQSTPGTAPKEGDACPMHSGKSHDCCRMTNGCDGPGLQLVSLFALVGFLEPPHSSSIVLESAALGIAPQPPLLVSLSSPDAPPPKA